MRLHQSRLQMRKKPWDYNLDQQHIQAHMLQNFLDGSNIQRNQLSLLIELLCASMTMILMAFAVYRLPLLNIYALVRQQTRKLTK